MIKLNNNVENNQNNNGNILNNNTINVPNNNALNNNTTNISNNISKENREELVKLYVGANYEQIALGGFSYCCFLFGWGYLFYRKYYKLAIFLIAFGLITSVLYIFTMNGIVNLLFTIISLLIQVYIARNFKKGYIQDANDYIDEKLKQNISYEELKIMCKKAGGTDAKAFLAVILFVIIFTIISSICTKIVTGERIIFHFHEDLKTAISNGDNEEYNKGAYSYQTMSFTYEDNYNQCDFEIIGNNEYVKTSNEDTGNIAKRYLKDTYSLDVNTKKKKINKINLDTYYDKTNNSYYYFYINKKTMYLIKVDIIKSDGNKCSLYKDYIIEKMELG